MCGIGLILSKCVVKYKSLRNVPQAWQLLTPDQKRLHCINIPVTILLATAAAVVGRSVTFGLSAAIIFFLDMEERCEGVKGKSKRYSRLAKPAASISLIYIDSLYRFVIGNRLSLPKARVVIFTPGGAWRRLYSLRSTRRITRSTVLRSKPIARISSKLRSFSA